MKEVKRLTRCENGHFFDSGKYDICPHCNNTKIPVATVFIGGVERSGETVEHLAAATAEKEGSIFSEPLEDVCSSSVEVSAASSREYDNMTVHYFQKAIGTEPVVGWLVCVSGLHFGEDFRIKSGRNFIGRSGNMNISLSADKAVSRDKHAILTYDPKSNSFMIQPGESSELFYLNDEPVLIPTKLKINDRILIGETELVFIPFCSDVFYWGKDKNNC